MAPSRPLALLPLALWLLASAARAPDALHPRSYESPSGGYRLLVDPTDRSGDGPADYVLLREGRELWRRRHPFTWIEAVVADDGAAMGHGWGYDRVNAPNASHVAALGPDGAVRSFRLVHPTSVAIHGPAYPHLRRITLQAAFARAILHVELEGGTEEWWVHSLETGEELSIVRPAESMREADEALHTLASQELPGTPLILANWWCRKRGGAFSLVELGDPRQARTVWSWHLPRDYERPDGGHAGFGLLRHLARGGAFLEIGPNGRFALARTRPSERVAFVAQRDETSSTGWEVRETERTPYELVVEAPVPLAESGLPEIDLTPLDVVALEREGAPSAEPAFHPVLRFSIDEEGRFGFLRRSGSKDEPALEAVFVERGGEPRVVRLAGSGALLPQLVWIEGPRWLVLAGPTDEPCGGTAAWLDRATGLLEPIGDLECFSLSPIVARSGDGGFVLLASTLEQHHVQHSLRRYDRQGRLVWSVEGGSGGDPFLAPQDVTVAASGEVLVVDAVRKELVRFGPGGNLLDRIELEPVLGFEPRYPGQVEALSRGRVLLRCEPQGRDVVLSRDPMLLAELHPRRADGSSLAAHAPTAAPDGSLWTSDGKTFCRLGEDGRAEETLDLELERPELERIGAVAIGPHGAIHVADAGTARVHVFDWRGRFLRVLDPGCRDLGFVFQMTLQVAPDGSVTLRFTESSFRSSVIRMSAEGQRIDPEPAGGDEGVWRATRHALERLGPGGETLRTIERDVERRWLENPGSLSVAPDGSVAFLSGSAESRAVIVLSPGGDPLETHPLPFRMGPFDRANSTFDGRRYTMMEPRARWCAVLDREGGSWSRVALDAEDPGSWTTLSSPAGELWLFDLAAAELRRFRFPR